MQTEAAMAAACQMQGSSTYGSTALNANKDDKQGLVEETLAMYATCRVNNHVPRDTMQVIKQQFQEILQRCRREVGEKIRGSDAAEDVDEVMQNMCDAIAQTCRLAEQVFRYGHGL